MLLRALSIVKQGNSVVRIISKSTYSRSIGSHCQYNQLSRIKVSPVIDEYVNAIRKCEFHTTRRLDIPPVLALLVRPLTRLGAFVFGRLIKRWWAKKTPEQKELYRKWFSARRQKIYGVSGFLFSSLILYYLFHIEEDPHTGRKRFIILNKEQQKVLSELTIDTHLELHGSIAPPSHPGYVRLIKIINKLIQANQDLPSIAEREWTLTVVDSDEPNAYVLPGGNIFVFLGALKIVENDDQLAIILAHEIAHVLLLHSIESISRNILIDILTAVPLAVIWAIYPDLVAFLFQALGINLINILATLPYSRKLEKEADDVGMALAAKACIDVREAVVFWGIMKQLTDINTEMKEITWLSTHPNHEDREVNLKSQLPKSLELRSKSGCPTLSRRDPIVEFHARTPKEHRARFAARGLLK